MTESESALDDDQVEAVRRLVKDYKKFTTKIRSVLSNGTGIEKQTLSDMVRTVRPTRPTWSQAKLIVDHYLENKFEIPASIRARLGLFLHDLPPLDGVRPAAPVSTFISNVGIDDGVARQSTGLAGDFFHFSLDANALVVTTKCYLLNKLSQDKAPIFVSVRYDSSGATDVNSVGAYFFNQTNNLYLIGTPEGSVNLRLSVFDLSKETIIRGVVLGVRDQSILSSRCVIVTTGSVKKEDKETLYKERLKKDVFEGLSDLFDEIGRYLFGEEPEKHIDLIKLATTPVLEG